MLCIAKIIASSIILSFDESQCDLPLRNWVIFTILNESIHLLCSFFECYKIISVLQTNDYSDVSLNDSVDSHFINVDFMFPNNNNERNNEVIQTVFLIREINKM